MKLPFVSRAALERQQQKADADRLRAQQHYKDELEALKARIEPLVKRLSHIGFQRDIRGDRYRCEVTFDARMMAGLGDRASLAILAEMLGKQVTAEIASCRFVESANEARIFHEPSRGRQPMDFNAEGWKKT